MPPVGLDGVCVRAGILVNEACAMVDGEMRVTSRLDIPVRWPAIADDR
jgi:hypothetical protein